MTDKTQPEFSFALDSDVPDTCLHEAVIRIGDWEMHTSEQTGIAAKGLSLTPFTEYSAELRATDNHGESASGRITFHTGRMGMPWAASWITDESYSFPRKVSPAPMTFRRGIQIKKPIDRAYITATALGVYELFLNGEKVGRQYFAPGFTSYPHTLQYQYYDVTEVLCTENELTAVVGGGWAVGRFTYQNRTRITADRQALLLELFIDYADGTKERILSDSSWQVTEEGPYRFGDFYDGETYDATVDLQTVNWKPADCFHPPVSPQIVAQYGSPVIAHETLFPVRSFFAANGRETIYDFGQNLAGVVSARINGKHGHRIMIRHAEILQDGDLCVQSLRTAKAAATYICRDGAQDYSPRLTYMGFRYVGISGIDPKDLELTAKVLHSDFEEIGSFSCSNELLNRLQSNIRWSGRSNLMDIPTDCPQRDERQGWTGDIAVFARTAVFNFGLSRFLGKWLKDLRDEQTRFGGIPHVIPKHGYSAPSSVTACWGDACVLVPWAQYLADGNLNQLRRQYPTMKRFLRSVKFWASLSGPGKYRRHIWKWLFQFGDWCAPGEGVRQWMGKGKWVATAYYANSCTLVARIADLLGETDDAAYYSSLAQEITAAYRRVFTDGAGNLKREFQTGYVLPLYFEMTNGTETDTMAANLNRLVRENDYHLSTGFTGTPYLLFALADHGYANTAYRVLLQESCRSWLYCVKAGATTMWEQWDALKEDGTVKLNNLNSSDTGGKNSMVSFNHYAYGAVGDFLYRRVAGLEALEGGCRRFTVRPVPGGDLTWAKASTETPYGIASVSWRIENGEFSLTVTVPVSTSCLVILPSGKSETVTSGTHRFMERLK